MGSWRGGWGFTWGPGGAARGSHGVLAGRVGVHMGSWRGGWGFTWGVGGAGGGSHGVPAGAGGGSHGVPAGAGGGSHGVPAGAGGGSHGVPAGRVGGWRFTWGPCWERGGGSHGVPAGRVGGWGFTWGPCWAVGGSHGVPAGRLGGGAVGVSFTWGGWGFTCPFVGRRPATWGSHALLPPRHLGFTCPPAPRPATWGSHALLRPACYTPLLHLMPQPPATFHEAFLPERKFPSLKPDDRGPRNPPPPTRSVDECFFGKL